MTEEEYKQMLADREAGTHGMWWADPRTGDVTSDVSDERVTHDIGYTIVAEGVESHDDACRIARVPDMEGEIIRLREALSLISAIGYSDDPLVNKAIARLAVNEARAALKGES